MSTAFGAAIVHRAICEIITTENVCRKMNAVIRNLLTFHHKFQASSNISIQLDAIQMVAKCMQSNLVMAVAHLDVVQQMMKVLEFCDIFPSGFFNQRKKRRNDLAFTFGTFRFNSHS